MEIDETIFSSPEKNQDFLSIKTSGTDDQINFNIRLELKNNNRNTTLYLVQDFKFHYDETSKIITLELVGKIINNKFVRRLFKKLKLDNEQLEKFWGGDGRFSHLTYRIDLLKIISFLSTPILYKLPEEPMHECSVPNRFDGKIKKEVINTTVEDFKIQVYDLNDKYYGFIIENKNMTWNEIVLKNPIMLSIFEEICKNSDQLLNDWNLDADKFRYELCELVTLFWD